LQIVGAGLSQYPYFSTLYSANMSELLTNHVACHTGGSDGIDGMCVNAHAGVL
jgi:hypothetical protein